MNITNALVPANLREAMTRPMRVFFTCTFLNALGTGLTYSFFVIYLHNVRHFTPQFATLLLATSAVASLATGPLWGTLVDRLGPLRVALFGYATSAGALTFWAFVTTRTSAIVVAVALFVFGGAGWGPNATLLSRLAGHEFRQRAFGLNFMLLNLGIGFGSLVSASIVNLHHPVTFSVLYLLDASTAIPAGVLFFTLRAYGGPVREHLDDPVRRAQGWRTVLKDRRLVQYVIAAIVLLIGGYGSQEAGYSLFVVNNLHLSVHALGVIFFLNTTTIVLAQRWTLNRIAGRSRTRVLAAVGLLWFIFWVTLAIALAMPLVLAFISLGVSMIIFAIAETMLQPVGAALVNEIAPEHLRGRYNAAAGIAWGLSGSLAPLVTAVYFGHGLGNWWPLSVGMIALVGSTMMLNLRRSLSASEDGRPPAGEQNR